MAGKWQFDGSVTFDSGEVTIVPFDGAVALYGRGVVAATPFNGAGPSDRTGGVVGPFHSMAQWHLTAGKNVS